MNQQFFETVLEKLEGKLLILAIFFQVLLWHVAYEELIVTFKKGHSFQNVNFFLSEVCDQNPII